MLARRKKRLDTRRKQRQATTSARTRHKTRRLKTSCNIPIRVPVLRYSSPLRSSDFFTWVNQEWLQKAKIKPHETLVDAGAATDECLYETSIGLLRDLQTKTRPDPVEAMFQDLAASALHSRAQHNSLDYLKQYLNTLHCVKDVDDVFQTAIELNTYGFRTLFELQITLDEKGTCQLLVENNPAGLFPKYYKSREIMKHYTSLLKRLGDDFGIPNLADSIHVEKYLIEKSEEYYTEQQLSIRGSSLPRKFPAIPWETLFSKYQIRDWKSRTIYYTSPRYIRFIGRILKETPIDTWKVFFARCFILSSLAYLPPPYDELDHDFFGRLLYGQRQKTPQHELLMKIIAAFLPNEFSQIFWKAKGNTELQKDVEHFTETILQAAKHRVKEVSWLQEKTRIKALEKLDHMKQSIAIPSTWLEFIDVKLDPTNLLKNRIILSERSVQQYMHRLDKRFTFWEDVITRVNASYYKRNNQIVIPYGQMQPPFYSLDAPLAWKYGALGSIIGHEICHGFDDDGKDYDAYGRKKEWWSRKNNHAYKKKAKALVHLFSSVIMQGHRVKGDRMLSENLADLAGVSIALQALKEQLKDQSKEVLHDAYRTFFIAYATSWRTKYRKERLTRLLEKDVHAPANLRVNLVVSQFQEWVDAFSIPEESPLYRKPEERIVIF